MIAGHGLGRLLVTDPSGAVIHRDLPAESATLGRAPTNDVVLGHQTVSSRHAQISRANGQVVLTDTGSMNGTRLNGVRVAAVSPHPIRNGDQIAIGPYTLTFQAYAAPTPLPPPAPGLAGAPPPLGQPIGSATAAPVGIPGGGVPGSGFAGAGIPGGGLAGAGMPGSGFAGAGLPPVPVAGDPNAASMGVPRSIDLGSRAALTFGRAPTCDVVLDHPQISREHARLERQGATLQLTDLDSTNGTHVNGTPIARQIVSPGDHFRIGPFDFVVAAGQVPSLRVDDGVRIDAVDLTTRVSGGAIILQSVRLTIFPREFVAVVGGSGWGKSTLVKALAGVRPATSGTVLYNGLELGRHFAAFRSSIGYVPQDDIIHRDLTVERALEYAAQLRLPGDTSAVERRRRVHEVLAELGLTPHRAKYIDDLSGGQRKRVSIGVELLTRPSLFFLDEPTSGLDPATETQVMRLLRELANQGRTLVLITHATQNIALCDKVVFMARGGYLAFYGTPKEALAHFQVQEFVDIYDALEQEPHPGAHAARYAASPYYAAHIASVPPPPPPRQRPSGAAGAARSGATAWLRPDALAAMARQYAILTARYFEITFATRRAALMALAILLLQAPVIAFLLGLVFPREVFDERPLLVDPARVQRAGIDPRTSPPIENCDLTQEELDALPASLREAEMREPCGDARKAMLMLFLLSVVAIWLGASNAAKEIVKELPIYVRERMVCVQIVPYLGSKLTVLFGLCFVQATMLVAIILLMIEFPLSRDGVLVGVYVTVLLTFFTATLMGLCVSALSSSTDQAGNLIPILLIPQIIFAGAMLAQGEMGIGAQYIGRIVISRWSWEALGSILDIPRYARAQGGPMLSLLDEQKWKTTFDISLSGHYTVLLLFGVLFIAGALVALKRKDTL